MPRRNRVRRRRMGRAGRRGGAGSVTISGTSNSTLTIAAGNTSVVDSIDSQGFAVMSAVGMGFKFYRFNRLTFVVDPVIRVDGITIATSSDTLWTLAYSPEQTTHSLTTLTPGTLRTLPDNVSGTMSVSTSAANIVTGETVPRTLRVRPATLRRGLEKMWYTQGSPGAGVTQGFLALAVGTAVASMKSIVASITMKWSIQFLQPEDASVLAFPRKALGEIWDVPRFGDETRREMRPPDEEKSESPSESDAVILERVAKVLRRA